MSSSASLSPSPTCNHCVVKAGKENDSNSGNENEIAGCERERLSCSYNSAGKNLKIIVKDVRSTEKKGKKLERKDMSSVAEKLSEKI